MSWTLEKELSQAEAGQMDWTHGSFTKGRSLNCSPPSLLLHWKVWSSVWNTPQPQCDWTDSHGSSFILRLRRFSYNLRYEFKNLSLISKIIQGFHLLNTTFFSIFLIPPHVHSHEKCAALKAAAPTAWKLQTNLPHGDSLEHVHSTSMQTFRDSVPRLHSLFPPPGRVLLQSRGVSWAPAEQAVSSAVWHSLHKASQERRALANSLLPTLL